MPFTRCTHHLASQAGPRHTVVLRRWESSARAPSRPQSRAREERRRANVDVSKVDLVGPPDPVSNIRPMYYAPVPSTSHAPLPSRPGQLLPHPYSLSEFSQSSRGAGRATAGLGRFKSYRDYVDHVSGQVEEADMKLRVGKMSTDTITHRFWRDNNLRFTRDLQSWREDSQRRIAALPDGVMSEAALDSATQQSVVQTAVEEEMSRDESAFYANWLRANGRRNRSYNVLVWKQAWEQVSLGARVALLRAWLRTLQRMQGR